MEYKVETHPNLVDEGYEKESFMWSVGDIIEEINRDRSDSWLDFDESDFVEGWLEFCEGHWYTIKALLPKESEVE
tara:strand:- start:584 stop:808 length:225 start_codon:yes stop_codon:yes gene_type:complete